MKSVTIKGDDYKIKVPKKSAFTIETPPDQLKLHQLSAVCASRGSGKSVIISSLLQGLKRQGCMDRIFLMSPTIESNRYTFAPLDIDPEDEYPNPSPDALRDIIAKCNEEMDDWEAYEQARYEYKLLQKILNNQKVSVQDIPPDLLIRAMEGNFINEEPKSKYGHKPVLALIVDDLQGTPLYNQSAKNPFINMCLRHRHIARGLGLSIFMAVQSYNSPSGIPRSVRQNLTTLFLGQQKNKDVLETIANELGGTIAREKFLDIFNHVMGDGNPHTFLMIDFCPKSPDKMFRKNLGEYIVANGAS